MKSFYTYIGFCLLLHTLMEGNIVSFYNVFELPVVFLFVILVSSVMRIHDFLRTVILCKHNIMWLLPCHYDGTSMLLFSLHSFILFNKISLIAHPQKRKRKKECSSMPSLIPILTDQILCISESWNACWSNRVMHRD